MSDAPNNQIPRPQPEDFGWEDAIGFSHAGGWQIEGGEEAYDAALAAWVAAIGKTTLAVAGPTPCTHCGGNGWEP
jgi:hypothetical protein